MVGSSKSPLRYIELRLIIFNDAEELPLLLRLNKQRVRGIGIEETFIQAVKGRRSQFIRIGFYHATTRECPLNFIPAIDEVKAWFPKLHELGYLHFD